VQAAVSYGLLFNVDPMAFLDRPEQDLPVLLSILDIGHGRVRRAQEETANGQRR
jgi:hypothetical protein